MRGQNDDGPRSIAKTTTGQAASPQAVPLVTTGSVSTNPLATAEIPIPAVTPDEVPALLESLLLVAPGATPLADLARGTGLSEPAIEAGLTELAERYGTRGGILIQRHGDTVQLMSAPRFAVHVRRFLKLDRETKLSTAALETLAIIAYQQPVTRAEVDAVRGVDSSGVLATLHGRGLVEQVGRLHTPGNPVQYGTTAAFLRHFGLGSVGDLPPLGRIDGRDAGEALRAAALVEASIETDASVASDEVVATVAQPPPLTDEAASPEVDVARDADDGLVSRSVVTDDHIPSE